MDGLNEKRLDEKLAELERARTWSPRVIAKIEALLRAEDPWTLYRINPIAFAAGKGLTESEAIDRGVPRLLTDVGGMGCARIVLCRRTSRAPSAADGR